MRGQGRTTSRIAAGLVAAGLALMAGPGAALEPEVAPPSPPARKSAARPPEPLREAVNAWTLGLAGGLLEGAPLRLAVDIARVVDAGEDLHVLPIVTRGPAENLESLLYLKGVDLAVVNSDSLARFRPFVPNLRRRIAYVLNLVPSELHVFVRPEIRSMGDLAGRKVNFNTPGTAAAYSGPIVFERLGVAVEKTFLPHPSAVEAMKRGEIAAVVFVTSKPVDAFARSAWGPGYHFLPVAYDKAFETDYLPSTLTSADYPALIAPGETVQTIAVSTFLAAYAWPKDASRHARMARFVDRLFGRIEALQAPGFHPKWADVDVAAEVAGLDRLPAAQAWIDRNRPRPAAAGQAAAGSR